MKDHDSSSRGVVLFRADERNDGQWRFKVAFRSSFMNTFYPYPANVDNMASSYQS